jgi:hypothetical protein
LRHRLILGNLQPFSRARGRMSIELENDATCLVKVSGSIFFHMLLGNVLGLNDVLFIPSWKKSICLVCMKIFNVELHLNGNNALLLIVV